MVFAIGFVVYQIFSPFTITEKKFWTLGYPETQSKNKDHYFPNLFFHTKKAISAFLYKEENTKEQFEKLLFLVISSTHCVEKYSTGCKQFSFHEMKKEYTVFINLMITEEKVQVHDINLNTYEQRLNKLLQLYVLMGTPRFSPKIYFSNEKKHADVIVNITLNKNKNVNPKATSDHCVLKKTIDNNILAAATISFYNTDIGLGRYFTYCESKLLLGFYDIQGLSLGSTNLSDTDTAIYLGLAAEYYRWLSISNNYPNNREALTQSIDDYSNYIYSKF